MKIRILKNGARVAAALGIAAMLLAGPRVSGAQTVVRGACKTEGVVFVTSNNWVSIGASAHVDIPDMSVSVYVQGPEPACVMVSFSATISSKFAFSVRPVLDGTVVGDPRDPAYAGVLFEEGFDSQTFNFFFTNVQPGAHTITMQLGTLPPAARAEVRERTLAVFVPSLVQFRGF
jgi:hypothetical protein